MEKLKFKFKILNDEEVDAKGYDLTICENLFGGSIFVLKSGAEIKYLKIKSVRSVLSGKNDIVVTDASDNHIVGIVEDAFDENNVHDCVFVSEIEPDVVKPPKPIDLMGGERSYYTKDTPKLGISGKTKGIVTWSSSDESIATVDSNGKLTFHSVGEVTITVETTSGQSASTTITVCEPEPLRLVCDREYNTTQTPTIETENAVGRLSWSSSDESIATVDSNGKLTFHSVGEVTITVETTHGQSDSITIIVEAAVEDTDDGGEDNPETSDEFTYTKEPGKIKKIFLHLYDGATLESVDVDPESTYSVGEGWDCYIDADGVTRLDLNVADDLRKIGDSTFDIVTAFDVNVTAESNLYDSIIEPILTDTNAHAKIFERISHDMETRNVEYTFTEDPTDSSTSRVIISNANDVRNFLHALAYSTRFSYGDRNGYDVTDFHVMGSDKVLTSDYYNVDHFDRVSYTDFDIYSNNISYIIDDVQPDNSGGCGFQGIHIIEKALETGRALDIGVDLNSVGWDAPIIKPRNQ